jgi:hypothetical protein
MITRLLTILAVIHLQVGCQAASKQWLVCYVGNVRGPIRVGASGDAGDPPMPLSATLDGVPVYSVLASNEEWRLLRNASKEAAGRLRMRCCPTDAVAKVSPKGLPFFAHKGKRPENCQWRPVSEEHETLKAVAARTVHGKAGWTARIEESEGLWRADVLAERRHVRIAIEIQLSPQGSAETQERNTKFEASNVVPFWLKGHRNHSNDFGQGLQERILGDDLKVQSLSVRQAVENLLSKVERQIEIARAARDAICALPEWEYEFWYYGRIPSAIFLHRAEQRQTILLGELGATALPPRDHENSNRPAGRDDYAGAIIQLRMKSAALRGYGCYGFQIDESNSRHSTRSILHPILSGKRRWMGRDYREVIPGSFVYYDETCLYCQTKFLRVPYAVIGNPKFPAHVPPRIEGADYSIMRLLEPAAKRLGDELGLKLGPFYGEVATSFYPARPTSQTCPQCGSIAPEPLISKDEAMSWPYRKNHFKLPVPLPGKGWMESLKWKESPAGDVGAWKRLMDEKFAAREREREAARARREEEQRRREAEAIAWRKKVEEDRTKKEEEQRVLEEKWKREEEQKSLEREQRETARRKAALTKVANKYIKDSRVRDLWLRTAHPKMGSSHPIVFACKSDANLELAVDVLENLARR